MATAKLLEHLQNIRILSDFKKSGLSNIDEFWQRIHEGKTIKNLDTNEVHYGPSSDIEPSEKDLEQLIKSQKEKENWEKQNDRTELYLRYVAQGVFESLEKDHAEVPELVSVKDLKEIVQNNSNLQRFLGAHEELLKEYIELSWNIDPDKFFSLYKNHSSIHHRFSKDSKSILNHFNEIELNAHNDVFAENGYKFFQFLIEYSEKKDADYAFYFWKLKEKKFIHPSITEGDFKRFLDTQGKVIDRLKPLNTVSTGFREKLYLLVSQLLNL